MSAQKVVSRIKRVGKEAYQFKFSSTFEYIKLKCNGTWRPTQLRVVWFRNYRRVESIPVHWVVSEDRGPNGASGKGKFQPAFSVGLVVTLYKSKFAEKFEGKDYKYYIQDESEKGTKILASFKIDLGEFANIDVKDSKNKLEMTFHCESSKVEDVVLEMTLSSRMLKSGNALDDDMQSTFSALTNENDGMQVDSDDDGDNEEEGGGSGGSEVENSMQIHVAEVAPLQLVNGAAAKPELNRIQNEKLKKEKKVKSQFRRIPIEDQQGGETFPNSPPALTAHPSLTDSVHRPWEEITEMIQRLQHCVQKLENENKVLHASMEIQGWLFKRGVRGLTARVWRRRFFRCEGINKICYYKTICSSKAQGFIDLDLVLEVKEACPDEQDKNCSTFLVQCEGRTYQLQAIDQMTMKKWMSAIQFLAEWRKSHSQKREVDREESTDDAITSNSS